MPVNLRVGTLAGSYPKKLPAKPDDVLTFVRHDYKLYRGVCEVLTQQQLPHPAFGDYGIMHPEAEPTSGSQAGGGGWPIIRYCTFDEWQVHKPKAPLDGSGLSAYFELARRCVVAPSFMGSQFSRGDEYISARATSQRLGGGNSTNYISADANHHIVFVAAQQNSASLVAEPVSPGELAIPTAPPIHSSADEEFWD